MTANALEAKYRKSDNPSKEYKYPHDYPGHWVDQTYLPTTLKGMSWYRASDMGREKALSERLAHIVRGQKEVRDGE